MLRGHNRMAGLPTDQSSFLSFLMKFMVFCQLIMIFRPQLHLLMLTNRVQVAYLICPPSGRHSTNNDRLCLICTPFAESLNDNERVCRSPVSPNSGLFNSDGASSFYEVLGDCNNVCVNCDANFWYEERAINFTVNYV
ncbi:uncharacterized protein [Rutidosis leptorrhynchoides]|uniref:uncharacterized protein n=1 Tax=Rutidosis leptorrhynchoides TaxID=125765 RepID=UPI003A990766